MGWRKRLKDMPLLPSVPSRPTRPESPFSPISTKFHQEQEKGWRLPTLRNWSRRRDLLRRLPTLRELLRCSVVTSNVICTARSRSREKDLLREGEIEMLSILYTYS